MISQNFFQLKALDGTQLLLIPLKEEHIDPLSEILFNTEGFFEVQRGFNSVEIITNQIRNRLKAQNEFQSLTYVFIEKESNAFCGMSTFLEPGNKFKRIEIGFTWIAPKYQRSYVNSEAKMLMLAHAFQTMNVARVEFSVDPMNEKSNIAMKRLGAKLDGTLRKWRFNSAVDPGDRNIYSILDNEFEDIKNKFSRL